MLYMSFRQHLGASLKLAQLCGDMRERKAGSAQSLDVPCWLTELLWTQIFEN